MQSALKYIELKSGYSDNGPAWIGKVGFSKSGKSIYFNGRGFRGNGHGSSVDIETGEVYWISSVKKNNNDRHWAGKGKIMIDKKVVQEYLQFVKQPALDPNKFVLVDIEDTDKQKFMQLENAVLK